MQAFLACLGASCHFSVAGVSHRLLDLSRPRSPFGDFQGRNCCLQRFVTAPEAAVRRLAPSSTARAFCANQAIRDGSTSKYTTTLSLSERRQLAVECRSQRARRRGSHRRAFCGRKGTAIGAMAGWHSPRLFLLIVTLLGEGSGRWGDLCKIQGWTAAFGRGVSLHNLQAACGQEKRSQGLPVHVCVALHVLQPDGWLVAHTEQQQQQQLEPAAAVVNPHGTVTAAAA